jgi:hypothetical protein
VSRIIVSIWPLSASPNVTGFADRLCYEAKPGQILISPRVPQAVEKVVTVEHVGDFTLKGIRRPMFGLQCAGSPRYQTELMSAYGTNAKY